MIEIFIEGKRLDVNNSEPSLLTFQVDDIKDFSSRNTTYSKTIILPGTANNNALFGSIFNTSVQNPYDNTLDNVGVNFNPSISADCLIFQGRLQIFKGTLRILEVSVINGNIEYEVAVFGELGGLVAALGNNKLENLDFSAYDTVWTIPNITGSWDNINGSGVCFPMIDYGGVSQNKIDYDVKAFRPALYVREIIDKILTDANYRWDCDLFNTSRFKSLIIPNNQKNLQSITNIIASGTYDGSQTVISNVIGGYKFINQNSTTGTDFTYSNGEWEYTGSTTQTFTIRIRAIGSYSNPNGGNMYVGINKNNASPPLYFYPQVLQQVPSGTFDFSFDYALQLVTGDKVGAFAYRFGSSPYSLTTTYFSLEIITQSPTLADTPYNGNILIQDIIPKNITQVDFLRSMIRLFNLYVYEDRLYPKKLLIKPYVDYYDLNPSGVLDWTYKVDRSREIRIKPMSELNSRYYNFKFKEDGDYYNDIYKKTYNEVYGDYVYDSNYQMANEKTDIQVIFSPSVLVGYENTDKIVSAFYKLNNSLEERTATNIRILQAKKITGVNSWAIKNGTGTIVSGLTSYCYAGHYDDPDAPANDIHFGVPEQLYFTLLAGSINITQFNVYWSPYMAEISDKDSKLMSCYMKLNNADIFDLDFSKLIYVDGSYWRLNKIEDWNATEPDVCKVELLKVINTLY